MVLKGAGDALDRPGQAARIAAARSAADLAGIDLFVNARIDACLRGPTEPAVVAELVAAVPGPVNVMVGPGAPSVEELTHLGVASISVGPRSPQLPTASSARHPSKR